MRRAGVLGTWRAAIGIGLLCVLTSCHDAASGPTVSTRFDATITGGVDTTLSGTAQYTIFSWGTVQIALVTSGDPRSVILVHGQPGHLDVGTYEFGPDSLLGTLSADYYVGCCGDTRRAYGGYSEGRLTITERAGNRLVGHLQFAASGYADTQSSAFSSITVTAEFEAAQTPSGTLGTP